MTTAASAPASWAAAWPDLAWQCRRFDALELRELHYIYMARQKVFAIEQQCAYLDADGFDEHAFHLAAWSSAQSEPLAYARLLDPGTKYARDASIGRVITTAVARRCGLGRELMRRAIEEARSAWPLAAVRISAQTRLEPFYCGFGFVAVGLPYLEDGIDHTEMVLGEAAAAERNL